MLQNFLYNKVLENLENDPTNCQKEFILKFTDFILNNDSIQLLVVNGYAGTGKTSVIGAFVKTFQTSKIKNVLLAPTGRAAKVLSEYAKKQAYTIHKKIYRQKSSKDGFGKFVLDKNLHTNTIFIVDEASMISNSKGEISIFGSGKLLTDLIEYVYNNKGCRIVFVGDTAQLPPVGIELSPALDIEELKKFLFDTQEVILDEVVRQSENSGILHNATIIRNLISKYEIVIPKIELNGFADIQRIQSDEMLEILSDCYEKYGNNETIVLCRSNKNANKYNAGIRNRILYREEIITRGDLLMVVKNNYYWFQQEEGLEFIANGDIIEIMHIHGIQEMYGFYYADVVVRLIDYDVEIETKLMLDVLSADSASLSADKNKELFYKIVEDYDEIKPKKKQYEAVRSNEYFNALQVKYAYAITCHKSQGGQWKAVFIDQGYFKEDMVSIEYLRWLYTAITRATEKVYLVNFPDQFFN